ncbi:MAG: DrmB family protein, partial [Pseudonocardiaceae bacterium]
PHLDAFYPCDEVGKLMMLGAANQWFSSTLGLLALPREEARTAADVVPLLQSLPKEVVATATGHEALPAFRMMAGMVAKTDVFDNVEDGVLWAALESVRSGAPPTSGDGKSGTDPLTILAPEWAVLTDEAKYTRHSGSADFRAVRREVPSPLTPVVTSVVAVEKLKKVNAFIGFTRIDALDRIDDAAARVAPLSRNGRPSWVPATEDRGEGFFLQFDEPRVAAWEQRILGTETWERFRQAHRLNFARRTSRTASDIDPDTRFQPPRYWALHTLSHLMIREAAMSSGYGSASLAERLYAWKEHDEHGPAAGLLLTTTASDSEGTLGGLVELSRPDKLAALVRAAIRRGSRCSSDPICSHRVPRGKEEFLHGAACHFCLFVSE